ncbi:LicD family protein [Colwellia sp. MB02u-6]|uniref:LicD family protein n=1 Tax=Colwellia sp. MB02u-6 TaxID=2759824 RepID=UPI0015F55C94|nr:LicD family protein [Colwellia sp. MB02u-6]MBA6326404.1 LicD family protein [Colwellia sp. MB02u-6]
MKKIIKNEIEYYTREGLELHQNKLLELLNIVSEICFQNNIIFWLDGGSLLGQVRHNKMIPWDDDIDLCIPILDYQKLILLLDEYSKKNKKFTLLYKDRNLISWSEYFGFTDYVCEYKWGAIKPIRIDLIPIKEIGFDVIENDEMEVDRISKYFYDKNDLDIDFDNVLTAYTDKKKSICEYNSYMENNSEFEGDCFLVKGHGQFSPIKKVIKSIVYPLREEHFCGIKVLVPNNKEGYLIQSYGLNYMSLPPLEKRKPMAFSAYPTPGFDDRIDEVIHFDYTRFFYKNRFLSNFKFLFFLVNTFGFIYMLKRIKRNMSIFFRLKSS